MSAEEYLARGLWCSASVGWSLPMAAARWPDRVAVALAGTAPDTARYTFAELLTQVETAAADLAARGVRPGDRVVAQLPNRIELLVLVLAAWHLGAVAVPVVPIYRAREMTHILQATRPAAVAAAATRGERRPAEELDAILSELGHAPATRYAVGGRVPGWHQLPATPTRQAPHWPTGADDTCLVLFTSGTTSAPKGARHSSRSLLAEARSYRDQALLGPQHPVLVPAPVAHIGAVVACTLLPCVTAAATVLDADGWFYTGDIGVVDAEGWVTIQGRLKDVINRGGEKFPASEIEQLIASHPDIDAVAVVGLPDQRLGERVGAFVTVRPGRSWPGEAGLLAHLERHQLARQKFPVIWQVLDRLPRTSTGKVQKRDLRDDWLHSQEMGPGVHHVNSDRSEHLTACADPLACNPAWRPSLISHSSGRAYGGHAGRRDLSIAFDAGNVGPKSLGPVRGRLGGRDPNDDLDPVILEDRPDVAGSQ
jgi:acyl-CoA synthetase (AMP-forming)/AMP-acid ligase II